MWVGDKLYNGHDAVSTSGELAKCGVDKIAERGIVGRGVLVDAARYRGVDALGTAEPLTLDDILGALDAQRTAVEKHDNLLLRTGWLSIFYTQRPDKFYAGDQSGRYHEPGLVYSPS
jgi:hypothetical protein